MRKRIFFVNWQVLYTRTALFLFPSLSPRVDDEIISAAASTVLKSSDREPSVGGEEQAGGQEPVGPLSPG